MSWSVYDKGPGAVLNDIRAPFPATICKTNKGEHPVFLRLFRVFLWLEPNDTVT